MVARDKEREGTRELLATPRQHELGETIRRSALSLLTRLAKQRPAQLALCDDLTGLPNGAFLHRCLRRVLASGRRETRELAVVALELGLARAARDAGGPPLADAAQRAIASRLRHVAGAEELGAANDDPEGWAGGSLVARTGEDSWVVVLDGAGAATALSMAHELRAALSAGVTLGARELFATPAIGVSLAPRDGDDSRLLVARAELAMRRARACGTGVLLFDEAMADAARRTAELENRLRGAVARREEGAAGLMLACQPRVNVGLDAIVAVEARVVWEPSGRPAVAPAELAALAGSTGLASEINRWAVRAACVQGRTWMDDRRPLRIVLVVATAAALEPGFAERVAEALDETGLEPGLLALQLDERALAAEGERALQLLGELRRVGVQLELQGATLPSRFRVHAVKLDRAHVEQLADGPSREITRAAIAAAMAAGQRVVLDGVETATQVRFCLAQRVHEAQGAFLGGPVRADEISVDVPRTVTSG